MYSNTFKPIGNLVKAAFLTGAFICSHASSLWASGAPELSEAEMEIVYRVSNFENADLTQTAVKLVPQDQRILIYYGAGLGCDMPLLEALYHVLKPQPITSDEYQVYQGLIQNYPTLLRVLNKDCLLHQSLRLSMQLLVAKDLSSTDLSFNNRNLRTVNSMIGHYKNVSVLDFSCNQLTQLPPAIGQLAALQWLNLSFNQLTHLPAEIGQLAALQRLDLGMNQLTHLPPEIGQLAALQTLDLVMNQLTHLPREIGQLDALQWLNLSENWITHLPAEIGQLAVLQELYLDRNKLKHLPLEIGQLSALQTLNLSTQFTYLSPKMDQLVALQSIYLPNNLFFDHLNNTTVVQGNVNGVDHIRKIFPRTTNIIFTEGQFFSCIKIFGTRE